MTTSFEIPQEADSQAFYQAQRSDRIPFVVNDIVVIKAGERKGERGWIVSLLTTQPETRYTVELCSGQGDLNLKATEVALEAK